MARTTAPIAQFATGNKLFRIAATVLGLDESVGNRMLAEVVAAVGSSPQEVTAQELGVLLPEIERRVHLLVPHEMAARALGRLRQTLLAWDED
jgi:hypothetical protein